MKRLIHIITFLLVLNLGGSGSLYGQYSMSTYPQTKSPLYAQPSASVISHTESSSIVRQYGGSMSPTFNYSYSGKRSTNINSQGSLSVSGMPVSISKVGAKSAPQLTTIQDDYNWIPRRKTVGDSNDSGGFGDDTSGDDQDPDDRDKPYPTPRGNLPLCLIMILCLGMAGIRKEFG